MRPEVKERWVAELRSGRWRQGRSYLRWKGSAGEELCCLGVLCELAVADGVIGVEPCGAARLWYRYGDPVVAWDDTLLPPQVVEWAGLADGDPLVVVGDREWGLSRVNDSLRFTFPEIADRIEACL
jgi:hypothetical protein